MFLHNLSRVIFVLTQTKKNNRCIDDNYFTTIYSNKNYDMIQLIAIFITFWNILLATFTNFEKYSILNISYYGNILIIWYWKKQWIYSTTFISIHNWYQIHISPSIHGNDKPIDAKWWRIFLQRVLYNRANWWSDLRMPFFLVSWF